MPKEQRPELPDPADLDSIGEIVRHRLTAEPNAVAVTYGDRDWTWTEFDARVRHFVTGLRSDLLKRGQHIAVLNRNHPSGLEALFASAYMGVVCTFVDPRLSPAGVLRALNEAEARFLFVGYEFEEMLGGISIDLDTVISTITVGGPDDEYEGWLEAHETHEGLLKASRERKGSDEGQPVARLYSSEGPKGPTRSDFSHRRLLLASSETIRRKAIGPEDVCVVEEPLSSAKVLVRAVSGMAAGAMTTLVHDG